MINRLEVMFGFIVGGLDRGLWSVLGILVCLQGHSYISLHFIRLDILHNSQHAKYNSNFCICLQIHPQALPVPAYHF